MNLAQAVDLETLRLAPSGIRGAFAAAVRDVLGRIPVPIVPYWRRPEATAVERLQLTPGSAKAEVVRAIDEAGRALRLPEIRAALPKLPGGYVRVALVDLIEHDLVVRHGEVKHFRYALQRRR